MKSKIIASLIGGALLLCNFNNLHAQNDWQSRVQPGLLEKMTHSSKGLSAENVGGGKTFRVIVNLRSGRSAGGINRFGPDNNRLAQVAQIQNQVIASMDADASRRILNRYQSTFAFSANLSAVEIEQLARRSDIEVVEEMPVFRKMDTEAHSLTGVDQMHTAGHTGQGSVIAIIDDGIDHDHPAFGGFTVYPNAKILGGHDFADNDTNPRIDCLDQSHGTATTGVAVGNGGGITGTAPDANVVFLKVQAQSECGQPSLSGDVAAAIDWVVTNKGTYDIDIISMSLGGGAYSSVTSCENASTAYRNAVNAANAAGIAILAASGNDGLCSEISHPSCMSNVISVGAVYDASLGSSGSCVNTNSCANTQTHQTCAAIGMVACFDTAQPDGVTCYSNSASFLDILAPSNCATTAQTGGGVNTCFSGTSSATPYAAGVAASLIEAAGGSGSLDNAAMRSLLTSNGVSVTDGKNSRVTPRVDAVASVNAIGGGGGGGNNELSNGVAVNNLSAAQGNEDNYTMAVPSGASDLSFQLSGGSGDADLYVRFGSAPTTATYDCRPYLTGNNETCNFASPSAGTWHVMVRAYATYSGASLVGSFSLAPPNNPPTAAFTSSVSDLDVSFTDTSSDSDGNIVSRSWTFGDGGTSASTNPSHSYSAAGTYTVSLTVTDDDGATDSASASVTVTAPTGGAPCTACTQYSGNLTGTGDSDAHPNGTYYYSASSGNHDGWLEGPSNADFDLELYKWSNGWRRVASSASGSSSESISYSGTRGYYYWKILSYSGSGNYDFWLDKP